MSRYPLKAKDSNHEVVVGWDPPQNSFFAHVIDVSKDEDDEARDVLWIGCRYKECHRVEEIISKIRPYVDLTSKEYGELTAKLLVDSD